MTKIDRSALSVYGHFSQPPRGNPVTRTVGAEPQAAPYQNWNERITEACYRPNAQAGNFQHISYSIGEALLQWLKRREPDVYQQIIDSDKATAEKDGLGNALATAYHHLILPLARKRDKHTEIVWGIAAFESHFGRKPLGFWLPEMAVDLETLGMLADAGIQYTLVSRQQVRTPLLEGGSGPFEVKLSRGRSIKVLVRDDQLSSDISFNIHNLGGAGHWARNTLVPARKSSGPLLLLATEGETFGHHYAGEDQFLYWLVTHETPSVGYQVVTLDAYITDSDSYGTVQLEEPSSWSDEPGLTNWATGEASKNTVWKGSLRRALDNACNEIDRAYEDLTRKYQLDAWALRDAYAPVLLGEITADEFLAQFAPKVKETEALKDLLAAEELALRMYNSYTFTGNNLDSAQPRYAIACIAAAMSLAQSATGQYLAERLLPDLAVVTADNTPLSGADILRHVMEEFGIALQLTE